MLLGCFLRRFFTGGIAAAAAACYNVHVKNKRLRGENREKICPAPYHAGGI